MGSYLSQQPQVRSSDHIYVAFCSKISDKNTTFSNYISRYDPRNNIWSIVSLIPGLKEDQVLKDFGMVSIGDLIYIIGGRLCRRERYSSSKSNDSDQFLEAEAEVRSTTLCYNVKFDQWSHCVPLSLPRYNFACTICDNKIYVAGGQYELASAKSTSRVEVYDPSTNEWSKLPNMRRLRYKCVGVTWQGKVHVVGGFINGCDVDQSIAYVGRCSAEVYDEELGKWDLVPGMWQLDVPPNQIVALEDKLFSSGDCLNAWKGHIEIYDGNLNLWNMIDCSQMKSLISPSGTGEDNALSKKRLYVTMAAIGSYLYFLAGYKLTSGNTLSVVHRFNTAAKEDVWTSFEASHEEGERDLCSHCCVATHS